jgi:hypothetical protein
MTCVNSHSFSPRLTVAKRKEALELRKVREGTTFDTEMGDSPHHIMYLCCVGYPVIVIIFIFPQTMKPLMEKRRRARINDSLDHLKSLIIPLTGKDVSDTPSFI